MTNSLRRSGESANGIPIPENIPDGGLFVQYIRQVLFPTDKYALLKGPPEHLSALATIIESARDPTLKFRGLKDGAEFCVDATFQPDTGSRPVECCKAYQLERFRLLNAKTPVYMAVGMGERPEAPDRVFVVPVGKMLYSRLYWSFLSEFEVDPRKHIDERLLISLNL